MRLFAAAAVLAATITPAFAAAPQAQLDSDAFLSTIALAPAEAAAVEARCEAADTLAKRLMAELAARTGPASVDTDFRSYDALANLVTATSDTMNVVAVTNPNEAVRDAAQACSERLKAIGSDLAMSRPIHDRLAAIPTAGLDEATGFILGKVLLKYRLAGVDKDAATRAQIAALNKRITATGVEFERNVDEDKTEVTFDSVEALAGLPQDYIDSHQPAADGKVHVTMSFPDAMPVPAYADRASTRKAVYLAFNNRAYPINEAVLARLLAQRHELARLLGYDNYAALVTADKMTGSPARVRAFLDEVDASASAGSEADMAILLQRLRELDPGAETVAHWDAPYVRRLVRKEKYEVDSAQVRQYFTLEKTREGIFGLVHDLFGSDIRPWDTPVWAPGVTAWELHDGGQVIGRFFLDMSPREGKFSHLGAMFMLRSGMAGRQVPVSALVANVPATGPIDHNDVVLFLHEFGHLMHSLYSGRQQFAAQSMDNLEWDFIEAPSQLFEQWAWDYDTLKTFASNEQGEPIPEALVAKMDVARRFGEASSWKGGLGAAAVSLGYYERAPGFDLAEVFRLENDRYAAIPESPEAHYYAGFTHLNPYSAIYYTYVWSQAIALDMGTRFKAAGLRDPATALAFREAVLEPGGSKPAAALIEDFLGRPSNTAALHEELVPRVP